MTYRIGPTNLFGLMGLILAAFILVSGGCGSSPVVRERPGTDENLDRLNRAAQQAFDKGRIRQAASFYRKALERATMRDDLNAIIDAQYNLAVCFVKLQSYAEALDLISQTEDQLALTGQGKSADLLLLNAILFYKTAKPDDAWTVTGQILSRSPQPSSVIRSRTHFLRGLIASERGDLPQLRDAMTALGQPQNPSLRADRFELQGHLAMAEHDWAAAIEAFDGGVKLRRETLDYRAMVKVLALAGKACEKAGQPKQASIRYLRAGRSAVLQADYDEAQIRLNQAEQLANKAGSDQIAQEARSYLKQIQNSAAPTQ